MRAVAAPTMPWASSRAFARVAAWTVCASDARVWADCASARSPAILASRLWITRPTFGSMALRSEEHTSELQSLMRISYAVFCLKNKKQQQHDTQQNHKP